MKPLTLASLAALESPNDLRAAVGLERFSPALEAALDAMYAAQPTRDQAALWSSISPHAWPKTRPRYVAACIGRRGLKTSVILASTTAFEALRPEHDAHAAKGSRIYCTVIAPVQGQARESVRAIRAALDALAPAGVRFEMRDPGGATEIVITSPKFLTERVIAVMPADAVTVRGFAICFAAFDEAAFLGSDAWLAQTDRDLTRALSAGMVQFKRSMMLFTSSPGPAQGQFYNHVTKPGPDTLVIRAATWQTNPRISEEDCRRIAVDVETFEQEFAVSRFGFFGDNYISGADVRACFDATVTGKGPRPGHFVIGLDVGQLQDQTAIVVASSYVVEIPGSAPVRHVVCEHAEVIESSRTRPVSIEAIVMRVAQISKAYAGAAIVFDPFAGPSVKSELEKHGIREAPDLARLRPKRFFQLSMAPTAQTPRWKLLRDLVKGRRLHLAPDHDALAEQLSRLKATQMSSGALKVEGKRDDLADALALAADIAVTLPATDGPQGHVQFEPGPLRFDHIRGITQPLARWVRVLPNGTKVKAEPPEWDERAFDAYARDAVIKGIWTPAIGRWLERQADDEVQKRNAGMGRK